MWAGKSVDPSLTLSLGCCPSWCSVHVASGISSAVRPMGILPLPRTMKQRDRGRTISVAVRHLDILTNWFRIFSPVSCRHVSRSRRNDLVCNVNTPTRPRPTCKRGPRFLSVLKGRDLVPGGRAETVGTAGSDLIGIQESLINVVPQCYQIVREKHRLRDPVVRRSSYER